VLAYGIRQRTPGTLTAVGNALDDSTSTPDCTGNIEAQRESPVLFPPDRIGCNQHLTHHHCLRTKLVAQREGRAHSLTRQQGKIYAESNFSSTVGLPMAVRAVLYTVASVAPQQDSTPCHVPSCMHRYIMCSTITYAWQGVRNAHQRLLRVPAAGRAAPCHHPWHGTPCLQPPGQPQLQTTVCLHVHSRCFTSLQGPC